MTMTATTNGLTSLGVPHRHVREIARAELPLLIQRARECRTITYGELGQAISLPARSVDFGLTELHERVLTPLGLPPLWAIVVRSDTHMPSTKVMRATWAVDGAPLEPGPLWRALVLSVYGYPWERVQAEMERLLD